jgi:hypothetical protein
VKTSGGLPAYRGGALAAPAPDKTRRLACLKRLSPFEIGFRRTNSPGAEGAFRFAAPPIPR